MANLLDTIRQNSQAPEQGVTDETSKLQGLLRAKSGKSLGGSATTSSNLGEQQAVVDTNSQLQNQVAPVAAIQNAGLQQKQAGIQQNEQLQRNDISQASQFDTIQNKVRTQQLLNDLSRDQATLDMRKDGARLEQVGASLRLQDKQYIDNLQREGQKARLDNSLEFNQALTNDIFNGNQSVLEKKLGNQSILNANNRDFQKAMAEMNAEDAYTMFRDDQKAQKERALYTGIGALAGAGAGGAGAAMNSSGNEKSYSSSVETADNERSDPNSDVNMMKARR